MDVVAELERVFLPLFREARQGFQLQYPQFEFSLWSSPTGNLSEYQGHDLGIECVFPDAADHESSCVAVSVGVWHITTSLEFIDFSVYWCSGVHPAVGLELISNPVAFSCETLHDLAADVPTLIDTFHRAVESWIARGTSA